MKTKITETIAVLPERKISNSELEELLQLEKGYIEPRTLIRERGAFPIDCGVERLYLDLFDKIVKKRNITRFDSIVIGMDTVERQSEMTADLLRQLGKQIPKQYTANCPGSISAIIKTSGEIEEGRINNALILAVSRLYDLVSKKDIGSSVLWGDAAAGILLERSENASGVVHYKEHKDESLNHLGIIADGKKLYCKMDGRGVTNYVLRHVPELINQCLGEAHMDISDIDHFIFHQANGRLLEALIKILHIQKEKVPTNIDKYGNTGIASPLIIYAQLRESGKLKLGMNSLFAAFGLGENGKGMQSDVLVYKE